MASQTPKTPAGRPAGTASSDQSKKASKNRFAYIGTIVILGLLIVAFVIVLPLGGVTGGMMGGHALDFGSYAGKGIIYGQGTYFASQVQAINDQLHRQGLNESNYQFYSYQVYRGAFERTVVHMGILDAVKKAGISISDTMLDKKMAEYPAFQENGKFSVPRYQSTSLSEKLDIRNQIKDDLLIQEYYNSVLALSPSSKETSFVADMGKNTRTIEYVALPLSSYPDSEVAAWGAANSGLFRRLNLSRITIDGSQSDAEALLKQIQKKAVAFDQAAKDRSKDQYASKGGAMGSMYFNAIISDLADKTAAEKLASLKKGDLSPVFKTTSGGWAFFMADDDAQAPNFSDPLLLKDVRDYMNRFDKGTIEDWVVAKAKPLSAATGSAFEVACRKQGLKIKTDGPFPINYGDLQVNVYGQSMPIFKPVNSSDANELQGASTNDKFLLDAFSLAPGSVSEPIVLGDNVIVMKVKSADSSADTGSIDLYYPYFFRSKLSAEIANRFLSSPKLKDNFAPVFFKYFMPKTPTSGGAASGS